MHTTLPIFDTFKPETPNLDSVVSEYATINAEFDAAKDAGGRVSAVKRWDALRIKLGTWQSVVHARFTQDTRNEDYKSAKDRESELSPKFLGPETEFKKMLLKSPHRAELEAEFGAQAFRMWENDVITFDPKIEADLVVESKLASKYTSLKSAAQILFRGESYNLSRLAAFAMHADRATRQAASEAQWEWFAANAALLISRVPTLALKSVSMPTNAAPILLLLIAAAGVGLLLFPYILVLLIIAGYLCIIPFTVRSQRWVAARPETWNDKPGQRRAARRAIRQSQGNRRSHARLGLRRPGPK